MKETHGDLWDFHKRGNWVCIPVNGTVTKSGAAVMGRGVALQATQKYPNLRTRWGATRTKQHQEFQDRHPHLAVYADIRLIMFPVKHDWHETADYKLIELAARELMLYGTFDRAIKERVIGVGLPRVGCGNGRLDWAKVRPILNHFLDDAYTIIHMSEEDTSAKYGVKSAGKQTPWRMPA